MNIIENLTKTIDSLNFAEDDLRASLRNASSVETIIILQLIKSISSTRIETQTFLDAVRIDENI